MSAIKSNATAAEIVANMAAFGLTWSVDPISHGGKVLRENCPVVTVANIDTFLSAVPEATTIVTEALDGSSIRVQSQRVARDLLAGDVTMKDEALKITIIDRVILKNRAERKAPAPKIVTVFKAMDGTDHATVIEARQASIAHLVTNFGMDLATAQAATANMV